MESPTIDLDMSWIDGPFRYAKYYDELKCALALEIDEATPESFSMALMSLHDQNFYIIHADYENLLSIWILVNSNTYCASDEIKGLNVITTVPINEIPRIKKATSENFGQYDVSLASFFEEPSKSVVVKIKSDESNTINENIFVFSSEFGFPEIISIVDNDSVISALNVADKKAAKKSLDNLFKVSCYVNSVCLNSDIDFAPVNESETSLLREQVKH